MLAAAAQALHFFPNHKKLNDTYSLSINHITGRNLVLRTARNTEASN